MRYVAIAALLLINSASFAQVKEKSPLGSSRGNTAQPSATSPSEVFMFVEQMPAPSVDIMTYISNNIKYPEEAKKKGVEGRVMVKFIVNEDGSLSDFNVVRGIGAGCDEEAVRVLKSMPAWKPGKQNGRAVKVYYTQPFVFKLG